MRYRRHSHHLLRSQAGMNLLEIMIVLVIVGLIVGVIGTKVFQALDDAKVQTSKTQAQNIVGALNQYRLKCGTYPTQEQGLQALIEAPTVGKPCKHFPQGGFIDGTKIPEDSWGNEFQYAIPGTKNPNGIDVWSNGPDGESGTEDDVGNFQSAAEQSEQG